MATHTYKVKSDGQMQIRMTDADGLVADASAAVNVGSGPRDHLPAAPLNVNAVATSTTAGTSTAQVTWESSDPRVGVWGLSVDGIPAGVVDVAAQTATVTDLSQAKTTEIAVIGFTREHATGTTGTDTPPAGPGYDFSGFPAPVDARPP